MLRIETVETPIGPRSLSLRGEALCGLRFDTPFAPGDSERTEVGDRVRAYFAGDIRALSRIPVDPAGTPFQQRVWSALREIPPGETRSYGQLARQLGTHPRAVGSANGANLVSLAGFAGCFSNGDTGFRFRNHGGQFLTRFLVQRRLIY